MPPEKVRKGSASACPTGHHPPGQETGQWRRELSRRIPDHEVPPALQGPVSKGSGHGLCPAWAVCEAGGREGTGTGRGARPATRNTRKGCQG